MQRAADVFATASEKREAGSDIKTLHAKIGVGLSDSSTMAPVWCRSNPHTCPLLRICSILAVSL